MDELKRHKEYATFNVTLDVLALWKALKDIHMTQTTSKIDAVIKKAAKGDYNNCAQGEFESITEFKTRFDAKLLAYTQHGNPKLTDNQVAMDFMYALDKSRYASFIQEIINDLAKKTMSDLKDLNEIYVLAASRVIVRTNSKVVGGATFATLDSLKKSKNKGVKRNAANKGGKDSDKGGTDKGGKDNGKPENEPKDNADGNEGSKKKPARDLSKVECWNCGKMGHLMRDCPEEEGENLNGCTVLTAATGTTIRRHEIAIDSCSDVSIVHPRFLTGLRSQPGAFTALGGAKTVADKVGYLEGFFECIACEDCHGSILSQDDIEKMYPITYVQGHSYIVHMNDRDLEFVKRGKFYIADFSAWIGGAMAMATQYTAKEMKAVDRADELVRLAGYPSREEAQHLVTDGNIVNVPADPVDVERYFQIYGEPVASVRGKLTKARPNFQISRSIPVERTDQVLTSDVMHVIGELFLIYIAEPLNLLMCSYATSEGKVTMGRCLQSQVTLLASRGFRVSTVFIDPQGSIMALRDSFPGIVFDPVGAKDNLPKIDIRIRRVKEMARAILSSLPFTIPKTLVNPMRSDHRFSMFLFPTY